MKVISRLVESPTLGIVASLLAFAMVLPAAVLAEITLSFAPLSGLIVQDSDPPDTLTVQVTVDVGADDLRGFSLVLEFDPTFVSPIAVRQGALMDACPMTAFFWLNSAAVGDSIAVDGAGLGCSMVGPGNLFEIDFVGVTDSFGTSPLVCRSVEMRDAMNGSKPVSCVAGTITHELEPVSVETATWSRVKSLYR